MTETMQKARVLILTRQPFFASVLLQLKMQEWDQPFIMGTDSVNLFYNPVLVESLNTKEVAGVICHEILHVVLLHSLRIQEREKLMWNYACDYAVNILIKDMNKDTNSSDCITLPKDVLLDEEYRDMTAEEIYNELAKDDSQTKEERSWENLIDIVMPYEGEGKGDSDKEGEGKGSANKESNNKDVTERSHYRVSKAETELKERQIKEMLAQAHIYAKMHGRESAALDRLVSKITNPQICWKEALARYVTESSTNDYTWHRPNRRYLCSNLYLPSLHEPSLGDIAVIIDTSGSICQDELDMFASELHSIVSSYPSTRVTAIYVDSAVCNVEEMDMNDFKFTAKGGGGTCFRPGFKYISSEGLTPSCILYFTDGYCDTYPDTVEFPVMWIVARGGWHGHARDFSPPFGEVSYIKNEN